MPLSIIREPLPGLMIVESGLSTDARGTFGRLFCERELQSVLQSRRIVQINQSITNVKGTVRGLHYQKPPFTEMKLIRCLSGKVWDVAVDLREASPTFLKWHAEEISPENCRMMVIPEGFAHGFQVLEAHSQLLYLHTQFYAPEAEGAVAYDEVRIGINWPLLICGLSDKDRGHPPLDDKFSGVAV